jgi:hypothetical protein
MSKKKSASTSRKSIAKAITKQSAPRPGPVLAFTAPATPPAHAPTPTPAREPTSSEMFIAVVHYVAQTRDMSIDLATRVVHKLMEDDPQYARTFYEKWVTQKTVEKVERAPPPPPDDWGLSADNPGVPDISEAPLAGQEAARIHAEAEAVEGEVIEAVDLVEQMAAVRPDLADRTAQLIELIPEMANIQSQIRALEKRENELKEELKAICVPIKTALGHSRIGAFGYRATVCKGENVKLDKKRLLEAGVTTQQIARGEVRTPYDYVLVTEEGQ